MAMKINQLTVESQEILNKINSLLNVLTADARVLTFDDLVEILNSDNTAVFIAEEDGKIVGMMTFVTYRIPSGLKAWIEDVAVDTSKQGKGIGKALIERAIEYAKQLNISKVDLTTAPFRVAANALYQKLGFVKRETNVYRLMLNS
jgi:Predicted acetyltransferase